MKWTFSIPAGGAWAVDRGPTVAADGTIYDTDTDGDVYAINPATGTQKWDFMVNGSGTHGDSDAPSIGADGTLYVGSWDNRLFALNPTTGMELWSYNAKSEVDESPAIGPDGSLYFVCDNTVFAMKGTPQTAGMSNFYLTPSTVTGGGSTYGIIDLPGHAGASGDVISLSSSDSHLTVPATVTVPAGQDSIGFAIRTASVTTTTVVTVTATFGSSTKQFTVTLNPA